MVTREDFSKYSPANNFVIQAWNSDLNLDQLMANLAFLCLIDFNQMNQYHNIIQGGKYGWKEGAD